MRQRNQSSYRQRSQPDRTEVQHVPQTRKKLTITPRNRKQREYVDAIMDHDITFGMGAAGTGKTHLSALIAVRMLTEGQIDKIVICRPAVPAGGERIGYLPGDINAKMDPYIQPIFDAFATYWGPQTIKTHMENRVIEIVPLAFMRGRTLTNAFVIADEMQNATADNLLMLLTRLGEGSKICITGDPVQRDLRGTACFDVAMRYLGHIPEVAFIHFTNADVVRHNTVMKILKSWPLDGFTEPEGGDLI